MTTLASKQTPLGWIGTGVMGQSMASHLLDGGYPLTVYSRTRSKAESLLQCGAHWAPSPAAVAEVSDIIFTMVGWPADVEDVYFGAQGLLSVARSGHLFVDMTTTRPLLAQRISREALDKGAASLDAPVSGGDVGARNARLSLMVGGCSHDLKRVGPILKLLGSTIVHQGPAGSGQHCKMCNQIVIAGTMIGVCESLFYARRAGLDPEVVLQSISGGAAACWSLDTLAPRILHGDYEPGFFVEHFVKDMEIALEEARRLDLVLPGLDLVHRLYASLCQQGEGRRGTQALILALENLQSL